MEEDLGNCPDAANDDTSDEESGNKDFMNVRPGLRKSIKYVDIEAEVSGGEGGDEEEHEWDQYIDRSIYLYGLRYAIALFLSLLMGS